MPVTFRKVAMTLTKPGLRAAGDLPLHPTLTHPITGAPIRALGVRRNGQAIWPAIGAADPDPVPPADPAPTGTPPADPEPEEPLRPEGIAALREEREARKALERQLAELAPLRKLAEVLGGGKPADGKSELDLLNERFAEQEKALATERLERWRVEVQSEKGLTPAQAKWLAGTTREELAAAADELLAAFPAPAPDPVPTRTGPRPDPAQGPRPGEKASSLDAGRSLYAERHKPKTTTS